ncbi:potential E3 ubiquitin-protein ligase ariadne-2-like isoform X1 [Mya arenaria]|uniref:potential E3 ubiquitin-protein ligase ariadne-2-like isoform X1 n=1 Tax=Mya arenaria TaxID=6604 RepID=UPI0022E8F61C|nr:potential E3 ubiquitin-protein ligase ariadne-2-like isoform X1 [Mya arenaria]XP_052781419.1 potential E3 ubiquitin-protein ligase ariadne-2-like isoform X1 [Mya arenaria]
MSEEMKSQESDNDSDYDQSDHMDDDDDYCGYYDDPDDLDNDKPKKTDDPEYFEYELLQLEDVERFLNEEVEVLCSSQKIKPSLAKMLLHAHNWKKEFVIECHSKNPSKLLVDSKIIPKVKHQQAIVGPTAVCTVCLNQVAREDMYDLSCGHMFCGECWDYFCQVQIQQGTTLGIQCMANDCDVLVPEDFLYSVLGKPDLREKYSRFSFLEYVKSHPALRFCPGPNCPIVVKSKEIKSKKVMCTTCNTMFCFKCGIEYHAPTDCDVIKKWLTKCADDSETANYISANTKDCPKCHVCIEKNGGCNHMQCSKCKYDFCWMCLGDWKAHGSEYYECSRYKILKFHDENPNIANESVHAQAREALKKYLFYFERWENHAKSLKLEEQTLHKITSRIQDKVMNSTGTWIDWQYLLDAANLLKKCRYTLQYTYPYAYYMEKCARKQLFEYQQAQLEAEVENLSWKVERAEITHRGDLENQMDIAEKRRLTLLKDFLDI